MPTTTEEPDPRPSPFPDRERRHLLQFWLAPRLDYGRRVKYAGGLIGLGLVVQLLWRASPQTPVVVATFPLLFAGTLFLLVRGYDLRPSGKLRAGAWEKTTRDRFQEVRDLESRVRSWDETFGDLTCVTGMVTLIVVGAAVGGVAWALGAAAETRYWAPIFAVDAGVLLFPHWITGTRRGWRPVGLRQQVDALETALGIIDEYDEPPCQIQPMFEMAGNGTSRVPVAARVFVRFPDGPDAFLGLQFQVALNNVQGTNYPYLYAVIVARQSFGLLDGHYDRIGASFGRRLTVEQNEEEGVEVIVIRQPTTKDSGYHTKPAKIRRIARAAWEAVTEILGASSTSSGRHP